MCHQSVGLISRAIEASGIATTSLSSAWSITQSACTPRSIYVDLPLGNTAGPPHDRGLQTSIVRRSLELVHEQHEMGVIDPFGASWSEPWKEAARALGDKRSERHDSPQYRSEVDREAALAAHGDVACSVCAAADVPVS